ncbi:hypothetical protein ONZ51_g9147 [Trametes cubensis]|uniref:Uncharacterized protein n=1 Tax=Trametes cubensis TaxID=1111947 RepID=A0AAD7X5W7_9APHY|nr:hypothetical protein ONZ51_g9147 [Trametes cubensis]
MAAMAPSNSTTDPFNMSPNVRPAKATAGPILVQGFLQYFCQAVPGVIISQGMKFYNRWADDPVALRAYVVVLLLFSLLQTILESYKTWVETIEAKHWPLHASSFAYPIWVYGTLAMALSLTSILSVSLWRTRTGLRHLDRTLTHIIFITFESAALPTACMLASAIVFSIRATCAARAAASEADFNRDTEAAMLAQTLHLDLFFAILTGKVYTLGILRTLNSRTQFRAGMHTSHLGRRSLTGWGQGEPQADGAESPGGQAGAERGDANRDPSAMRQGDACDEDDRFSGETVRVPDPGLTAFGEARTTSCLGIGMQKIPSAHCMTPKMRKSASRNSGQTPEISGKQHSPP